jgi:hypothetical protein
MDKFLGVMTEAALAALVGHRFAGGEYVIERWENVLLADCTGRDPLANAMVHPIAMFHVPILGVQTSIEELFQLGDATTTAGAVTLLGYDWEFFKPLHEGVNYRFEGGIEEADRRWPEGSIHDDVTFVIEAFEPSGEMAAKVTNRWRFHR